MQRAGETRFDWTERPRGSLGRAELKELSARLLGLPAETRTILLEWGEVTHVDFRGLSLLASRIRSLRGRGIEVFMAGIDSYLLAILRFSLSEEELELFTRCAGGSGQPPAGARAARIEAIVPHLSSLGISRRN